MNVTDLSGLPEGVGELLTEQGIDTFYPPQTDAIECGVLDGRNVVASVPTASGKTLIAVLAMLSSVERGGKALYIVPLRALASEKRAEFEQYEACGVSVGISTGNYESTDEWLARRDIVVATSEKVDSLIRNGASWIDELSCVVADEVHLVHDAHRGPTLEVTLAKLRKINPGMQIVALSATIGNAEEIASWLDADLIDSNWRPIDLRLGVQYGQALHFDDGGTEELPIDRGQEPTAALVADALEAGGSSLVFVNSRRNAEAAAKRLSKVTSPFLDPNEIDSLVELGGELRDVSDTQTSDDLATTVERGAAFHHAGLTSRHRSLIEDAFRDRLIKVICATPTLAAGVNTPSRRVIVRDWRRYDGSVGGMVPLSTLEVHQMCGRAGRPGLDPYGESFLLANSHEELEELFERYIWADPEPVRSKLAVEPALRTHILSTIASEFARSRTELLSFLEQTLYAAQTTDDRRLVEVTDRVLEYLEINDFVERTNGSLVATGIGHTVSRLYLDPMSAAEIVDGLRAARGTLSPLGLYHLVARTPDMYGLYLRSGDRERYTEVAYEREDEFIGDMPSEFETERFEDWLAALKTARMLEDWASEFDEDRVTERYAVGPGDLRGKIDTAKWLLNGAERLALELGIEEAKEIVSARKRVEYGVREELIDLATVRNVGRKRARRLYDVGITTRDELREADPSVVLGALRGRRKTAASILQNVGHPSPSLEDIESDETAWQSDSDPQGSDESVRIADGETDDQASLGDF